MTEPTHPDGPDHQPDRPAELVPTPEQITAARTVVNELWLATELAEPDRIATWVFEAHDPELGTSELFGPFDTREQAITHARTYRDTVTGPGETPVTTEPRPVLRITT